ncbi:MAG: hypothetical protein FH751_15705 [Firmicutes bacterium]|nr:hypothetical protein [Bacillota bacterium]
MDFRRIYYSLLVIVLTILTVSIMYNIKTKESRVYDKLNTDKKYAFEQFIYEKKNISKKSKTNENKFKKELLNYKSSIKTNEKIRKTKTSKEEKNKLSKNELNIQLFKYRQVVKLHNEAFTNYDKETIALLISQLEKQIEKTKLNQFKNRLNQEKTIPSLNINELNSNLDSSDKYKLNNTISKLGNFDKAKILMMSKKGITPKEQRNLYNILTENLSKEELINLNDILGRYIEK